MPRPEGHAKKPRPRHPNAASKEDREALKKLQDALTAADLLNNTFIPFFDEQGAKLLRVLTDCGT